MWRKTAAFLAAFMIILSSGFVFAQNLGNVPVFNRAVRGETATQPEGALVNFIN